jgi:hypothetical protein
VTLEYRRIGRLPTCIGNERIRIAAGGEVSYSRNTVECEPDAPWSAPWRPVGRLDAAALAQLTQQIIDTGVFGLEPESIDESAEGGTREEMDIALGEREYRFVAENTDPPPFRAVVKLLWGVIFELGF